MEKMKYITLIAILILFGHLASAENKLKALGEGEEGIYRMQEYQPNYFVSGYPDTKIQFSFRFRLLKNYALNMGYTQTLFWQLGKEESNPFSEMNFNPELFYRFDLTKFWWVDRIDLGYAHKSNGQKDLESRSYESLFVELNSVADMGFLLSRFTVRFRYLFGLDKPNQDIIDFYGPLLVKFYLTDVANFLLSEELYVEWYNGGAFSDDFSKGSARVSLRVKIFDDYSAPKIFFQYFNGYGENLRKYNVREETYRIGLSIGGQ